MRTGLHIARSPAEVKTRVQCATVFAARCYALARPICCRVMQCSSVCLSVRLSRSLTLSKRINISLNFSPSGSHTILVFLYQTSWPYSDGDPLTGTSNAGLVSTNRDSRQISGHRSMTAAVRTTMRWSTV